MILHLFLDDKYIYNRRNFMQEFLTYIKQEIKRKIKLDPQKEKLIDMKIISLLKKDNNLNTDEKKCYYIKIYTALYFDNLEILTLLNRNNFSLGIYPSNLGIYILDNSFTKHFTNISYIDFITRYKPYLHSFFLSIKDLNNKEKETYIKRFIKLTTSLDCTLKILEKDSKTIVNSLFTKKSLDTFNDNTYFSASLDQLTNIIAPLETIPSKDTIKRLNNLIAKTNFSMFYHNYDLMFELFSDEELLDIKISPEYFLTKALNNGINITRALFIYKHYPEIINNCGCLNLQIFDNYSDDEIINLSKTINFNSKNATKSLKTYNFKRRVLTLFHGTK